VEGFRMMGIQQWWMAARDRQFWGKGVYRAQRLIVSCSSTDDNNFKVFYGIINIAIAVCFPYSTA
jgi:hypothetical protein